MHGLIKERGAANKGAAKGAAWRSVPQKPFGPQYSVTGSDDFVGTDSVAGHRGLTSSDNSEEEEQEHGLTQPLVRHEDSADAV